jgi:hypothetical protein
MAKVASLDEIVELTKQLSLLDKVRLIEEIAPQIAQELKAVQPGSRIPGLHAEMGAAWMSDDFDEPLPDEFWLGTT